MQGSEPDPFVRPEDGDRTKAEVVVSNRFLHGLCGGFCFQGFTAEAQRAQRNEWKQFFRIVCVSAVSFDHIGHFTLPFLYENTFIASFRSSKSSRRFPMI